MVRSRPLPCYYFHYPLGRLSDKIGRKNMMTPGLLFFIFVPLFYIVAKTPLHLYPIRVLLGLGVGLIFGNGFLLMTKVSEPEHRNTAQGLYMTSMGLGFTVGPLIGGYTTKLYGNTLSFYLSSLLGLVSIHYWQIVFLIHESLLPAFNHRLLYHTFFFHK